MEKFGLKEAVVIGAALLSPGTANSFLDGFPIFPSVSLKESPVAHKELSIGERIAKLRQELGFQTKREECEEIGRKVMEGYSRASQGVIEGSIAKEICLARNGLKKAPFFHPTTEENLRAECEARGESAKDSIDAALGMIGFTTHDMGLAGRREGTKVEEECLSDYGLNKQ